MNGIPADFQTVIEETIKKYIGTKDNPLNGKRFSEIYDLVKEGKL